MKDNGEPTNRASKSEQRQAMFDPVESALADAIAELTSLEHDTDGFFGEVRSGQADRNARTLERYRGFADSLYLPEEDAAKSAFMDGVSFGLWAAEKMSVHTSTDPEEVREVLGDNRAYPVELRAHPDQPEYEQRLAEQLRVSYETTAGGFAVEGINEVLLLSDIPTEHIDDAQCGMVCALAEARQAVSLQVLDQQYRRDTEAMQSETFDEQLEDLAVEYGSDLEGGLDEASSLHDPYDAIDRQKVTTYLWEALQRDEGALQQVLKLTEQYKNRDHGLFQRARWLAVAMEPRDEDGTFADERYRAATHYMVGAMEAMRILDIESLEVRSGRKDWHQEWSDSKVDLRSLEPSSDENLPDMDLATVARLRILEHTPQWYQQLPPEYQEMLRLIEAQDGYSDDFALEHRAGFTFTYREGSSILAAVVRAEFDTEVEQTVRLAAQGIDGEIAQLFEGDAQN